MELNLKQGDLISYKVRSIGNRVEDLVVKNIDIYAKGGRKIYFENGTEVFVKDIKILLLNGEEVVEYADIRDGMEIKDREGNVWLVALKLYGYFTAVGKTNSIQVSWVEKDFNKALFRRVK